MENGEQSVQNGKAQVNATGLPTSWMRFGWVGGISWDEPTVETEKQFLETERRFLQSQAEALQNQLDEVKKRLDELAGQATGGA